MTGGIVIILIYAIILFLGNRGERFKRHSNLGLTQEPPNHPDADPTDIVYNGTSNSIGPGEIEAILEKHYPYYNSLHPELREKFLARTQTFIRKKNFIIKNGEGYREMPVLVSAAAIQLTFGLNDYLLPFYKYIRIYPSEYFGDGSFKVLAGNVKNNMITVAWNHFLKGNEDLTDGSNVGLHEMSHALYFQKVVIDANYARRFCRNYDDVLTACKEAYQTEIAGRKNLYSAYADTDLQEFWAESVEIFFEKPNELHLQYPAVYEAMKILLHQDPLNKIHPVLETTSFLPQKLARLLKYARV
ncbi:MAG TPA: zinc-dependent peptidase [Flavisolibacter sp.]|nr:zinc-dependent peptidase [Flavisolibacter sp.]